MVETGRRCACCGAQLKDPGAPTPGTVAVFCSNACRQRAYRRRQRAWSLILKPHLKIVEEVPANPAGPSAPR